VFCLASEAVLWFSQRLQVPPELAIKYGKLLHSKNIIENLQSADAEFLNNDHCWKFVSHSQTPPVQPEMRVCLNSCQPLLFISVPPDFELSD
jgi:hypothetical protein